MTIHGVPRRIQTQIITRILILIDCHLFNSLITYPELCTCGNAFHVKMQLSLLEEWGGRMSREWSVACRYACGNDCFSFISFWF